MNRRRLRAIANWLEKGAPRRDGVAQFNMNRGIARVDTTPACGTICCIAGAAVMFYADKDTKQQLLGPLELGRRVDHPRAAIFGTPDGYDEPDCVAAQAAQLLGLDPYTARKLFLPRDVDSSTWARITPKRAARVIRRLLDTGKVRW